jgi:metallo-beta-lactamase family protein
VTGSLHFFEISEGDKTVRFFLDAGLNQESPSTNHQNRLPSGIKASDVDFGILSHAHIDHTGLLPKLVKDGFRGKVYATPVTRELVGLLLPDCGYLQEQEAERLNRRAAKRAGTANGGTGTDAKGNTGAGSAQAPAQRGNRKGASGKGASGKNPRMAAKATEPRAPKKVEPLYTEKEAVAALSHIEAIEYDTPFNVSDGIVLRFLHASHILGAAIVSLEIGRGSKKRRVVFTGDLGRPQMPVLKDVATVKQADYVISEGTYGDKLHEKRNRQNELAAIINRAYERAKNADPKFGHGVIIIPAFAVGRVQSVLFDLRILMAAGKIPNIPVFLDSPMAIKATKIYRHHTGLYNGQAAKLFAEGGDLFTTPRYAELLEWKQSETLDAPASEPIIVVGSSGMASGGRIMRHLENRLPGKQNTVVFIGFQGHGTLGRQLVEPEVEEVTVAGKAVRVRATVEYMRDYSGHADYEDIIRWLGAFGQKPQKLFLVHGEAESLDALKSRIEERLRWDVVVPRNREFIDLS